MPCSTVASTTLVLDDKFKVVSRIVLHIILHAKRPGIIEKRLYEGELTFFDDVLAAPYHKLRLICLHFVLFTRIESKSNDQRSWKEGK